MKLSLEMVLTVVQQDQNSPMLTELIKRLCLHGMNYAANRYQRRLPYSTVYDWVVDAYISGAFTGDAHKIISNIRHRVDRWATHEAAPCVTLASCKNTVAVCDMGSGIDNSTLCVIIREILSELTVEEQRVIEVCVMDDRPLVEAAKEFGMTREDVRRIHNKTIRKLRHPHYSKRLKDFWV